MLRSDYQVIVFVQIGPATGRLLGLLCMTLLESANAAFRFGLELCALAALGYWGFGAGDFLPMKILLGVGAPVGFAFLWGGFISPKAPNRLGDPERLMAEATLFGLAAIALVDAGAALLAMVLVSAVVVNLGLMVVLDQRRQGGI